MTNNATHKAFVDAVAFFREHAGTSYNPRRETMTAATARTARELAAAEQYASAAGWNVETTADYDATADGDDDTTTALINDGTLVRLIVSMHDADGETLASLGGVIVGHESDPYVRVVAAELALEAMDERGIAPTVVMLRSGAAWSEDSDARSMRAAVFGHLAGIAAPIVEHYRSDLYHDAAWLTDHVTGPATFYWACDETGTTIGTDARYVIHNGSARKHGYRVVIDAHRETAFYVTLTREPR